MAYLKNSKSARVRARLDHPVVDGDGHWLEPIPIFLDYLRDLAGPSVVDQFVKKASDTTWYDLAPDERIRQRIHRPTWWGEPANTLDRATAMVPRLFYERLDDFGVDFCILYTSLGLFYVSNPDEGIRRAVARAVNRMNAEMFRPFADRITPAAVVPMHTPEEAIEEATYAVRELGLRVLMIANHVRRPVPAFARAGAEMKELRTYVDSLAFESAHDYDPFWQRCADLKVAVTAHSGSMGTHWRESVWSFTYNHIGHFANASHAFAKALILGGVTHRFPQLRFAFLEGGFALHGLYVVSIGGDFMVGRFWLPATAVALVLALRALPRRALAWSAAAVAALLLLWPRSALHTGEGYRPAWRLGAAGHAGIVDEKGNPPGSQWLRDLLRQGWPQPGIEPLGPPRVQGVLGRPGYRAHPHQILVDPNALADPLLARLPCDPPWQIGHFRRPLPPGYLESLAAGEDRLADPGLSRLYRDVRTLTSGPLFAAGRLGAALRLALWRPTRYGATTRCPGLALRSPGAAAPARWRLPLGPLAQRVVGGRLRLGGRAPAGGQVARWRLEVEVEPLPDRATLRCVHAASDARLEFEIDLDYADPVRAAAAAAGRPRVALVLPDEAPSGESLAPGLAPRE